MKIAFLSFYSGVVYRGVETFVHELANRLHNSGHNITVYQFGAKLLVIQIISVSDRDDCQERREKKRRGARIN